MAKKKPPSLDATTAYNLWCKLDEKGGREFARLCGWQDQVNELTERERNAKDALRRANQEIKDGLQKIEALIDATLDRSDRNVEKLVAIIVEMRTRRRPTAKRNAQWEKWRAEGKTPKMIQQLWQEQKGIKLTVGAVKQALKRKKRAKKNKQQPTDPQ